MVVVLERDKRASSAYIKKVYELYLLGCEGRFHLTWHQQIIFYSGFYENSWMVKRLQLIFWLETLDGDIQWQADWILQQM